MTLAAGLLTTATMPPGTAASQAMFLMSALRLAQALSDLYRQVHQTNTARLILRDTADAFRLVNADLPHLQAEAHFQETAAQGAPLQSETLPEPPKADSAAREESRVELPQPVGAAALSSGTPVDDAEAALVRRIRSLPGVGEPVDLRPTTTRRTPVRKPPANPTIRQVRHTQ